MTASTGTLQKRAIFCLTSAGSGRSVRQSRTSGWIPIERSSLTECCVGLVFSSSDALMYGHERQVDVDRVAAPRLLAQLPDRLEERERLDVADRAADLDRDDVGVRRRRARIASLISSVMCGIDLHGLAEVVAAALPLDDRQVDAAGRRVVDPRGPVIEVKRS